MWGEKKHLVWFFPSSIYDAYKLEEKLWQQKHIEWDTFHSLSVFVFHFVGDRISNKNAKNYTSGIRWCTFTVIGWSLDYNQICINWNAWLLKLVVYIFYDINMCMYKCICLCMHRRAIALLCPHFQFWTRTKQMQPNWIGVTHTSTHKPTTLESAARWKWKNVVNVK